MTVTTSTCPSWCAIAHTGDDPECHDRTILGPEPTEEFAWVNLEQEGDGGPRIYVDIVNKEQTLSPEEAARLAAALTEAVRLAAVTR